MTQAIGEASVIGACTSIPSSGSELFIAAVFSTEERAKVVRRAFESGGWQAASRPTSAERFERMAATARRSRAESPTYPDSPESRDERERVTRALVAGQEAAQRE